MPKTKTEGRAWLLVRGLARDSRHWGSFLEEFRKRFPDDEVECLDLAGNGNQNTRPSFTTIHESVEDLRDRSRLLKTHGQVSIVAISMGAMIAMDWSLRYPDEIASLILVNTSARPHSRFYERMRPGNYLRFTAMLATLGDREKIEREVLRMTTHLQKDLSATAKEWARWEMTSVGNFARQVWAASRFRIPRKPQVPTLLLASRHDELVNPICTRRLGEAWGMEWLEHETAGHDLPLDAPAWLIDRIQNWTKTDFKSAE